MRHGKPVRKLVGRYGGPRPLKLGALAAVVLALVGLLFFVPFRARDSATTQPPAGSSTGSSVEVPRDDATGAPSRGSTGRPTLSPTPADTSATGAGPSSGPFSSTPPWSKSSSSSTPSSASPPWSPPSSSTPSTQSSAAPSRSAASTSGPTSPTQSTVQPTPTASTATVPVPLPSVTPPVVYRQGTPVPRRPRLHGRAGSQRRRRRLRARQLLITRGHPVWWGTVIWGMVSWSECDGARAIRSGGPRGRNGRWIVSHERR